MLPGDEPLVVERRVNALENSYNQLKNSVDAVVDRLDRIIEQNVKMAVMSERQSVHQAEIEKFTVRLATSELNHSALTKQVTEFISFVNGVTKLAYLLWTTLGGIVFLLLIKILFFAGKLGFVA